MEEEFIQADPIPEPPQEEQDEQAPEVEQAPRELHYIRVNPGDTIESIAAEYDTTPEAIIETNNVNPAFLFTGHWLYV